jgi:inner membrane transporter RhtA
MYGLGGGTCWALYIIFGKQVGPHYGTQGVAIGLIVATLLVLPFGIAKAGIALFDPSIIPLAIVLSLLSMALPYSLEMVALTRLPASTFGILMSIEPVVATFSGLLFLDEKLTLLQWIAIAAIVLASAGTTLSHQKQQ